MIADKKKFYKIKTKFEVKIEINLSFEKMYI